MGVSGGMRTAKIYSNKEMEIQKPTWKQSKAFLKSCNPYITGQLTIRSHYMNYLKNRPKGDYFQVSRPFNKKHKGAFTGFLYESRIILAAYNYKCFVCGHVGGCHSIGMKGEIQLHHVIPLSSKSATDEVKTDIANVVPLCPECHRKAHGKVNVNNVNATNAVEVVA